MKINAKDLCSIKDIQELKSVDSIVSAKYCYATHELRLHQNDRCKRFTLV